MPQTMFRFAKMPKFPMKINVNIYLQISFLWTIPIHHAHFEELHKNRIQIYSICTWPKYMITSESFNERNILCIIFELLLQAHIPSLQISIRLNSMLRPLECFFESDLREYVHESTIPNGRRPIQVFQLDCITKERKKYQRKSENELYLGGDSEHRAEASKRLIWHILTLRKQDKNNRRPYNQKEESKGKEEWGSFEVSVFAFGWVSSQGAS